MTDLLFDSIDMEEINIDHYIQQKNLEFDKVELRTIPSYLLLDKIKLGGLILSLLVNDPQRHKSKKRDQLNDAVAKEIQRQAKSLVAEYNRRVESGLMMLDSQPKTFLGKHAPTRPVSQVVGLKTLTVVARRGSLSQV